MTVQIIIYSKYFVFQECITYSVIKTYHDAFLE